MGTCAFLKEKWPSMQEELNKKKMNTIKEVSGIERCKMILDDGYTKLTKEEKNEYIEKGLEFMSTFSDAAAAAAADDDDDDDDDEDYDYEKLQFLVGKEASRAKEFVHGRYDTNVQNGNYTFSFDNILSLNSSNILDTENELAYFIKFDGDKSESHYKESELNLFHCDPPIRSILPSKKLSKKIISYKCNINI